MAPGETLALLQEFVMSWGHKITAVFNVWVRSGGPPRGEEVRGVGLRGVHGSAVQLIL